MDPGFNIELSGEFESGEDYWQTVAEVADWVIEIDALSKVKSSTPSRRH